jgi:hypothetical protein
MKNILFENQTITYELEGGILTGTFRSEFYDLEEMRQLVQYRLNAIGGKAYPTIANIISIKKLTKETRDFLASEEGCEGIAALAILINSSIGSMIGNFWIKINKPLRPTKLFTEEGEAKKWLKQYVAQ